MRIALAVLIVLLALEGVALAVWPKLVKSIFAESHVLLLRIIGVLELVLIFLLLWILFRG